MTVEEFKNTVIPFSHKLYPMVLRILKNEEATRDALQEIMIKLWNRKNELKRCTNLSAYIITTSKNYCFDVLKKKRTTSFSEHDNYQLLMLEAKLPNPEIIEKYKHVHSFIEKLPEKYKTVIQMRDIDGLSFEEIKELTGFEVPHIRVLLSRARLKIKTDVEKLYSYKVKSV